MCGSVSKLLLAATVACTLGVAPAAKAGDGQVAAGIVGGLIGGAVLGSALAGPRVYAAPPPPAYYYAPEPVYVDEPECHWLRQQYWDGYGYRVRRIRVCD